MMGQAIQLKKKSFGKLENNPDVFHIFYLGDEFELLGSFRVLVRMVFESQFPVRLLQFVVRCIRSDS